MGVSFDADLGSSVATVSTLPEYQNAVIIILDDSLLTETYDYATNSYTSEGDAVIYNGRARISTKASQVDIAPSVQGNPTGEKRLIVQIPAFAGVIKRGNKVRVVSGGRAARLEQSMFTVQSDINSSHMGARTFEAVADVEVDPDWDVEE